MEQGVLNEQVGNAKRLWRAAVALTALGSALIPSAAEAQETEGYLDNQKVAAGSRTTIQSGIPNAEIAINITLDDSLSEGYVQALPTYSSEVGSWSNINAEQGVTKASLATVMTDAEGEFDIFSQAKTHLVVDVQGAFGGQAFNKNIPSQRLLDTREDEEMMAGGTVEFDCPANTSLLVNVTSVGSRQKGYVQLKSDAFEPTGTSSDLNIDRPGKIINRPVTFWCNEYGKGYAYSQAAGHLVIDLLKGFNAGMYEDIPNERLIDTREGTARLRAGALDTYKGSRANSSAFISAVVTNTYAPGFLQFKNQGEQVAGTSNINVSRSGETVGAGAIVLFDALNNYEVYTSMSADLVVDVQGFFANGAYNEFPDRRLLDTRTYQGPINFVPDCEVVTKVINGVTFEFVECKGQK